MHVTPSHGRYYCCTNTVLIGYSSTLSYSLTVPAGRCKKKRCCYKTDQSGTDKCVATAGRGTDILRAVATTAAPYVTLWETRAAIGLFMKEEDRRPVGVGYG